MTIFDLIALFLLSIVLIVALLAGGACLWIAIDSFVIKQTPVLAWTLLIYALAMFSLSFWIVLAAIPDLLKDVIARA